MSLRRHAWCPKWAAFATLAALFPVYKVTNDR